MIVIFTRGAAAHDLHKSDIYSFCAYGDAVLEASLGHRYAGFSCMTYTNDMDLWSNPLAPKLSLPFYKHKSYPKTSLKPGFRHQGEEVFRLHILNENRAPLMPCARVAYGPICNMRSDGKNGDRAQTGRGMIGC